MHDEKTIAIRLGELKGAGSTAIGAIRAIREEFGLSLNQAKGALSDHPDWGVESKIFSEIAEIAEQVLESEEFNTLPDKKSR